MVQVQPPAPSCDFGQVDHCFKFDICVGLLSFYKHII